MNKKKKKSQKPRRDFKSKGKRAEYDYHLPVLLNQACDYLVTNPEGIFIDGTLGGGGHSKEILKRLSAKGKLFGFDKDERAIEHCQRKFWGELSNGENSRLVLINECYSKSCGILEYRGRIDGILLDLGLSSRQLDESYRGFSYRLDSNIDMRFGPVGRSAKDILHAASEEEIEIILRKYGEEPFAKRIARRIVEKRRALPILTTFDLRAIVEESVPNRFISKSLSRVFQAFRIATNNELEILENTLNDCLPILSKGGRIVIIAYHSLEDRIVKNFFKEHSIKKSRNKYASLKETTNNVPLLKVITPKPIVPEFGEIQKNPRARSAKMRVAEIT